MRKIKGTTKRRDARGRAFPERLGSVGGMATARCITIDPELWDAVREKAQDLSGRLGRRVSASEVVALCVREALDGSGLIP